MYARIIEMAGVETVAELISNDAFQKILPPLDAEFRPVEAGMVLQAQWIDGAWESPADPAPDPDPPVPVDPGPSYRTAVTQVEYFGLFTPVEEMEIRKFAEGDTDEARIVRVLLNRLDNPNIGIIHLDNAQVVFGIDYLVTQGLLEPVRAAEIKQGIPE